ncbi:MAG: efflux RND transporter periplasmic adaptor subunit [Candidatus Omnitrophota bacterium]
MRKKIFIVGFFLLVLFLIGLFIKFLKGKNSVPQFRTETVTRGDITSTVTATGTINPVTTVLIGTQVSGTIKKIFVDYNSLVKKGQLIAQIDPTPLEAQVAQSRANLLVANANVAKAEASLLDAERILARNRELFSKNFIARSDLDTSETNYETAKALLNVAKAQVDQTKASLEYTETNLGYTRIVSPVDGVVIARNVDVGQTVAASFQTPTLFSIAQNLAKMQIDTSVDESDIGQIKVGQAVEFTTDAYPDVTFPGKVRQVRNAPITVQNVVTYDVVVGIDNSEMKLKPGMTANVSIIVLTQEDVLRIPYASLRFVPSDKAAEAKKVKGNKVWVLEKGTPKMVMVVTGQTDGKYTEVVSGQIQEGQKIIVESLAKKSKQPPVQGPSRGIWH